MIAVRPRSSGFADHDGASSRGLSLRRYRSQLLVGSILFLSVWASAARGQEAPPAGGSVPEPPEITPLRYTEDYSYLRDPAQRSDAWWEPYKFIPLDSDGWAYFTLGSEFRLRYEHYWNDGFGSGPKPDEGYLWARTLPYADLHLGPNFRIFGQLNVAYAARSDLTKSPIDETAVDVLQAFADLRLPLGAAGTATLRGGRQVMSYGSDRLISTRYGPNVLRSFDGGVARFDTGDWRIDAFFVRPVENRLHSFDDRADRSKEVWSLYTTRRLPAIGSDAGLDIYYIGLSDQNAAFNQGAGREKRHTLGTRFFGSADDWKWDVEGFYQFGSFAGGDVRAWSVATEVRYTFADQPLKPFVELRANIISGDKNPNDRSLESFNVLFPNGKYFGEIGLIGPSNLINVHPRAGIDLGSGVSVNGAAVFYWRESLRDGVYGASGNLLRPDGGSRSRYIGTQVEAVIEWEADRNLSLSAAYSIFEPGAFVEDTGPAETVHFAGVEALFRF